MNDCCATCRFWATEDNRQDPTRAQQQPAIMSYFPNMLEHGWCGEFSPRLAS